MPEGQRGLVHAWNNGAWWLWLLRPLEWLFRCLAALRRQLYASGLLSCYRADKPVVIVGNITVGGTGKTPIVIALVEALQAQGIAVGVVSRGYGARGGVFPHTVGDASTSADCGDEPLLIYQRTHCPCVVAPSRPAAVRALLESFAVDILICDDGLQHYALARDLEIAVLDTQVGVGNGFCLPAGPLREPVSRLRSVDYVLYRGSDDPRNGVCYDPDCLVNLATGEQRPVAAYAIGKAVYALAGIGQPAQFFASLNRVGFEVEQRVFPDHHAYSAADLGDLCDKPIIMTEKDAVKCREFAGANAWYLRINARLPAALTAAVAALVRT
jgi:tetraacyldisaccharide 4'-kinase